MTVKPTKRSASKKPKTKSKDALSTKRSGKSVKQKLAKQAKKTKGTDNTGPRGK